MPLQNRVLPTGEIAAHPARGLLMGNRGRLHTPARTLAGRRWTTTTWVACALCFNNRRRTVWGPNSYTELFFLDEAVALAAGHRPCAECRRADYRRWQSAWQRAHGEAPTAPVMNARLHADRVDGRGQRRFLAPVEDLPPGSFILADGAAWLVGPAALHRFAPEGYGVTRPRGSGRVTVLTPACTVAVLAAGYLPMLHPTAA